MPHNTPNELDAEVARVVMGWTLADRSAMGWGDGPPVWITGEDRDDENASPTFQDFRPSTDLAHTAKVIIRMRDIADGYRNILRLIAYPYARTYAHFGLEEPQPEEYSEGNGEHASAEAICRAALAVVQPPPTRTPEAA